MTEPTDADLLAEWYRVSHIADAGQRRLACLRAVLAKWGTLRAEKIVIPTDTMEQEFQKHYRRGYEAGKKATTSQPTQAQAGAVPPNWPTNEMIEAGRKAAISHGPLLGGGQSLWHVFRDMLAAAPSPQKQGGQHGADN